MRRRLILIFLAVVATLAISGGLAFASLASTPTSLSQPTWTLIRLVVNGQDQPLSSSRLTTLRFIPKEGRIAGTGGCSDYGGSYMLIGNLMRLSVVRTATFFCRGDPVATEQEIKYFQALPLIMSYRINPSTLTLIVTGNDGRISLTFGAT